MIPSIKSIFQSLNFNQVSPERKVKLQALIDYIQVKQNENQSVRLNFICTHNSRRSHLSQIWAQTAAAYYHVKDVSCYSGGTEATAMFPVVASTLQNDGFFVEVISPGTNPVYCIKFSENDNPIIGFSKKHDHAFNPHKGFAAIMTCSQADADCPFISGADIRIPLPFDDPKAFDNTPEQVDKYRERSLQIVLEMGFVFSQIK